MRGIISFLTVLAVVVPSSASQPGQPIDCSDWVIVAPGYRCENFIRRGDCAAVDPSHGEVCYAGATSAIDNEGATLLVETSETLACFGARQKRLTLYRVTSSGRQEIGFFQDRCATAAQEDMVDTTEIPSRLAKISFSSTAGAVRIDLLSFCWGNCPNPEYAHADESVNSAWIAEIHGFTTLFEELQSFTPQSSLGFRTPYMPDGMRSADRFDTFVGEVTRPLDLAQAHPLQCAYPSSPPHVGDYLAITSPVPNPAPGHANYVLTSVTYQGQTRAGRSAIDGHLHGRDASLLPPCVIEKKASNLKAGEAER